MRLFGKELLRTAMQNFMATILIVFIFSPKLNHLTPLILFVKRMMNHI